MSNPISTTHETSAFIINNNTIDSNGRQLLQSTSETGDKRFTRPKKKLLKNKALMVGLLVCFIIAVIVVIVLLVVNLSTQDTLHLVHGHYCSLNADGSEFNVSQDHAPCSHSAEVSEECFPGKWSISKQTKSLLSPLYVTTRHLCGLYISLSINYTGDVQIRLLSSHHPSTNMTGHLMSDRCNHVFLKNTNLMKGENLRVLVILPNLLNFPETVGFHASAFPLGQDPCCDVAKRKSARPMKTTHSACSQASAVVEECTHDKWQVSKERNALVSPTYEMESQVCGVHISFEMNYTGSVDLHIASDKILGGNWTQAEINTATCHHITLQDRLTAGTKVRVAITFASDLDFPQNIKFHISLVECTPYRSIQLKPDETINPNFKQVDVGHINLCSMEIRDDRSSIACDWWNLVKGDGNDFSRSDFHACIPSGIKLINTEVAFLEVTPITDIQTTAVMVSPVIERKSTSILFEFWYLMKCIGPSINIYLLPANRILNSAILKDEVPVKIISRPANHSSWKHEYERIFLPTTHDLYQLVIEAVLPDKNHTHCAGHYCIVSSSPTNATEAVIAMDDISIQLMHRTCNVTTGGTSVLDCKFQKVSGGKTTCQWKSSGPMYHYDSDYDGDLFDDWRAVNSGDGDTNYHGATDQHLEGRGYIMTFDATGKAEDAGSVRTPTLIANNSCSCTMRFLYLLRGLFTPRMIVNILYETGDEKSRTDTQWSLFGHQSEDWELATIPINLHSDRGPFLIEIKVIEVIDSKSDIHFDDVEFVDCDFTILEE